MNEDEGQTGWSGRAGRVRVGIIETVIIDCQEGHFGLKESREVKI